MIINVSFFNSIFQNYNQIVQLFCVALKFFEYDRLLHLQEKAMNVTMRESFMLDSNIALVEDIFLIIKIFSPTGLVPEPPR